MRYVSCYVAATKFIWLIALMSKTKEEVALALLTIFSVIAPGPPRILQSDQGGEFTLRLPGTTLLCYTSTTRILLSVRRFVSFP